MTEAGQNVTEAGQEGGRTSPREAGQNITEAERGRSDKRKRQDNRESGQKRLRRQDGGRTEERQDRREERQGDRTRGRQDRREAGYEGDRTKRRVDWTDLIFSD